MKKKDAYKDNVAQAVAARMVGDASAAKLYSAAANVVLNGRVKRRLARGAVTNVPVPFQVLGLQRTGTNLAVHLLRQNFNVKPLDIVWKHGAIDNPFRTWNRERVRYVLCVKNPYAQLVSCYRYFKRRFGEDKTIAREFHPSLSFEQFLEMPCYGFKNPIDRWNEVYRHWIDVLPAHLRAIIRQEDQLQHQTWVLENIGRNLGLTRINENWITAEQSISVYGRRAGPLDRDYYLHRTYLESYNSLSIQKVNREVDGWVLEYFGYEQEAEPAQEKQDESTLQHD